MRAPALQLDGLTKRFGDVVAVDDLTLTVERAESFGFLGPNGAGKSTTKGLGSTVLEASFDGPVPELADLSGVTRTERIPDGLRIYLSGPPGPVLARLADADVARLRSHEPSLEEIFLSYYSEPEGAAAAPAAS